MRGRHIKLYELLLGFEGLALLRGLVDGSEEDMTARIEEIKEIVAKLDDEPYSLGLDVPELDPRSGYAAWSVSYDSMRNPLIEAEQPTVEELVADVDSGRALDAACGTGRHSRHLASKHDVIGIDGSPEMLAVAASAVPEARFVLGDLLALPLSDKSVDLVVCSLALTHVTDLAAALGEFARVTTPGGRIVISDIHPLSVAVIGQGFFRTDDGGTAFVRNHLHLVSTYLAAFDRLGLRVVRCVEPSVVVGGGGLVHSFVPDAERQALTGLPAALVWQLERA